MQNFIDDSAFENKCSDNYSISCLNNCIDWILDAKIKANNQDLFYVNFITF